MATFAVTVVSGPRWVADLGPREQALWDEHDTFMDRLSDSVNILLTGPYADGTGALVIVEMDTDNPSEVRAIFETDPWVTGELRTIADVKVWQILFDARPC
ncbi:MAG TPA: hypothetical protein VFD32_18320 [Dehalococcoidia bacterium]|nr:hypothetical protein [Dehalococcoidia bacterium]